MQIILKSKDAGIRKQIKFSLSKIIKIRNISIFLILIILLNENFI